MTLRDRLDEVELQDQAPRSRFRRQGRLAPFPGAPHSEQVRCACDRCGSHTLAASRPDGSFEGVCPVCLSRSMHPVAAPHAAA